MDVISWLCDGDPAVAWQARRDLTGASGAEVARERARVVREGLGAAILARQGADGVWRTDGAPTWLATLASVDLLRATGADPADPAVAAAMTRLAEGFRWPAEFGALDFFGGEVEPCINGRALAIGAYAGRPDAALAQRLIGEPLADGGWNCDAPTSARASYHSTICVLEGLLAYERAVGGDPAVARVRQRGEAYLLERGMFRRRTTGEAASPGFLELAHPPRYHYDLLRGLDHLRDAGAAPEPRIADAIRILADKRQPDGTWRLDAAYPDGLAVELGEAVGAPSRWNTLRALRVLRWAES
ncbi:MAG: hypothetical protein K8W52_07060 [Deltaproteobacteria bacterium]|nr:hypothetical protein [Deltaproteobacteria bacterium]